MANPAFPPGAFLKQDMPSRHDTAKEKKAAVEAGWVAVCKEVDARDGRQCRMLRQAERPGSDWDPQARPPAPPGECGMKLCECGCGAQAPIAAATKRSRGWIKGQPVRFIKGHSLPKSKDIDSLYSLDATTGCWVWHGNRENGYGRIGSRLAYRVIYERANGPVPNGLELDHTCRNRACVNPSHLEPVSRTVNVRRGNCAKLDECDAFCVHHLTSAGETRAAIARRLGVSASLVSHIVNGRVWRDVFSLWHADAAHG